MPVDMQIKGGVNFSRLGAQVKATGNGRLRRSLLGGIRVAAKPMIAAARQSARDNLPAAGGLNELVARAPIGVRSRLTGQSAGVRISRPRGEGLDRTGRFRKPVFAQGPRSDWTWAPQQVEPGWFSTAMEENADEVRTAVIAVLRKTSADLQSYVAWRG